MSAENRLMRQDALEPFCIHGISLSQPCLKCEQFIRLHYPDYAPTEPQTIQ